MEGLKIEFHAADVTDLGMLAGPYDFVLDIGCLFGLKENDRIRYAGELARLLRPQGAYMLYAWLPRPWKGGFRGISAEAVEALCGFLVAAVAERAARLLVAPLLLVTRVYVAWQFLKSGWLKIADWETTQFLFEEEYQVPLVSPMLAAVGGTFGELVFPVLLILGLLTRYAAAGLFAVNIVAVVSYAHVLLGEGFEAALGQHYLWGLMLLVVLVFGPGRLSIDAWLKASGARPR